jgi:hypothetical protein
MSIGRVPGQTGIQPSIVDAKGDIIAATAADSVSRLAVGANDTVLTADSSTATGLKWAAPAAGGGTTLLSTTALSSNTTTISSISGSYKHLVIYLKGVYVVTDAATISMRLNGDTGSNYAYTRFRNVNTTVTGGQSSPDNIEVIPRTPDDNNQEYVAHAEITLPRYTDTDTQPVYIRSFGSQTDGADLSTYQLVGNYNCSAAITSITFYTPSETNFSGGNVYIYGVS